MEYYISRGKKFTDVTGNTWGGTIFHKNVIDLVNKYGLVGLEYFPIRIRLKKKGDVVNDDYFLVRSAENCGPKDLSSSEVVPSSVNPRFFDHKGYKLDVSMLKSGTDFLTPEGFSILHCTEKAKNVMQNENITGIDFINISEKRMPID
jgi:hypothetical protein